MNTRTLTIPVAGGHQSYSLFDLAPSRDFVIFIHGLGGTPSRTMPSILSQVLPTQGFNVLRLGLYDSRPGARVLAKSTLTTHAADLQAAIGYLHEHHQPRTLHLIGHSLGAATILRAKAEATSAVLIDPSHPEVNPFRREHHLPALNGYLRSSGGVDYLVGEAMTKEFNTLTQANLTDGFQTPSLIITAGASALAATGHRYAQALNKATYIKHVVVDDADHSFTHNQHLQALLDHTTAWLKERL